MIDLFMLNVDIEGKNEKLPVTQMGCLKCKLTFVSWLQKKLIHHGLVNSKMT